MSSLAYDNYKNESFIDNLFTQEKIDGKIYLMARPAKDHMRIQKNISKIFDDYFEKTRRNCEASFEEQLYIDENTYVIPDVMVNCYNNSDEMPLIVIEILSPSTRNKDLSDKMKKYAELGIKEYWIIDYKSLYIDIYALNGLDGKYEFYKTYVIMREEDFSLIREKREFEEKSLIREFSPIAFPELVIKTEDVFKRVGL